MPATYKVVEIVGTSSASFSEAVKAAIAEASKTVRNIYWFEVTEQRGRVQDGQAVEFQVTVKLGFKVER
jgi:flavin-binding protein dodecin